VALLATEDFDFSFPTTALRKMLVFLELVNNVNSQQQQQQEPRRTNENQGYNYILVMKPTPLKVVRTTPEIVNTSYQVDPSGITTVCMNILVDQTSNVNVPFIDLDPNDKKLPTTTTDC